MKRIWPPDLESEESIVFSDIPHLRDWCAYFEVNFSDDAAADRFVRHYGLRFPRAGGTVRGNTAWMTLRIGAADEEEAALMAAMSVKIAVDVKPATARPDAAVLHHVDEVESGAIPSQEKLREERLVLMRYAEALGVQRRIPAPPRQRAKPRLSDPDAIDVPELDPGEGAQASSGLRRDRGADPGSRGGSR
jgi:hypothetical protein